MFFRGKQREASIWKRFRTSADGFTLAQEGELRVAHVVAPPDRIVDLFYVLTETLPQSVDVHVNDLRSGRAWSGRSVALNDAREAIARLKSMLARYGGVEFSVFTGDDQLTLNPQLELFIYSRDDRWLPLLTARELEEQVRVRTRSWKGAAPQFPSAPELVSAVAGAVERLGLRPT